MRALDCRQFSQRFQVRRLSQEDLPLIYALCQGNRLFYEYCGRQVTEEDIRRDLTVTPPGKDLREKYYVGFFDGTRLTAVLDLIGGYPDDRTAFLGFFMMEIAEQGKGTGTAVISEVCGCLKRWGFQRVRLGFDRENPQSRRFWEKNEFTAVREVRQEQGVIVLAERFL